MLLLNDSPGKLMRDLRERLGIRQNELARAMRISSAVLSEYENQKRRKPGAHTIKNYINAIVRLRGVPAVLLALHENENVDSGGAILAIRELKEPIRSADLLKALSARVWSGEDMLDLPVFGYTVLDSIRAIIALKGNQFFKIFGKSSERALIFSKVGLGRSPLVAVRISPLKPRVVAIHGTESLEEVSVEIAKAERVILATLPKVPIEDLISRLATL